MKTLRSIVELLALWIAITLALAAAVVILLPADPPYLNQNHHRSAT